MKKLIIRADASTQIGTGHIMRCLTIADQMKQRNWEVLFYALPLEGNLTELLQQRGYSVIFKMERGTILLVDHYELGKEWEQAMRKYVEKIVVIDDLANRPHDCDVLLDQNLVPFYQSRYNELVPMHCKKLLGISYLQLRDEFFAVRKIMKERKQRIQTILFFFGGTDPTKETEKVLEALVTYNPFEEVHVVVGSNNERKIFIQKLCEQYDWQYYEQISYLAQLMNEVDFVVGAGGSSMWERCFIGVPSACVMVAENQLDTTKEAERIGAIVSLGWHEQVTSTTYKQFIKQLTSGAIVIQPLIEKGLMLTQSIEKNAFIQQLEALL